MLDAPGTDIVLNDPNGPEDVGSLLHSDDGNGEKNGLFSFVVDSSFDISAKPPWLLTELTANGFPLALAENDFILSGNKNGFEAAEEDMFMI